MIKTCFESECFVGKEYVEGKVDLCPLDWRSRIQIRSSRSHSSSEQLAVLLLRPSAAVGVEEPFPRADCMHRKRIDIWKIVLTSGLSGIVRCKYVPDVVCD